jgi:hypothetical protein
LQQAQVFNNLQHGFPQIFPKLFQETVLAAVGFHKTTVGAAGEIPDKGIATQLHNTTHTPLCIAELHIGYLKLFTIQINSTHHIL